MLLRAEHFFVTRKVWNNSYGLARTIIAFGSLANIVFNHSSILFRPHVGLLDVPNCTELNGFSLYCIFSDNLELARFVAIIGLTLVVIGWRPRVTCIIHWYITFSLSSTATVLDGGDHIATILTFLLIPICLTDNRVWHWKRHEIKSASNIGLALSIIAFSSVIVIRIQMSLVYLHAATAKLSVLEWQDGTAVYYWFTHPTFGAAGWLRLMLVPLLQNGFVVTTITWGTIVLELLLFAGLIASERTRKILLFIGIGFHFNIILIHGLFSFFFSMCGGLILYLWPLYKEVSFLSGQSSKLESYDTYKI